MVMDTIDDNMSVSRSLSSGQLVAAECDDQTGA